MKKKICLNMIVKNERAVLQRSLESTKPLIDTWVIVDTGSSDGTQELIREVLKDVPGELHERPWVDFSHNRNEALALAEGKADYLLFLDADDELVIEKGFHLPNLDKDFYLVRYVESLDGHTHQNHTILLINSRLPWKWEGVLHERLVSPSAATHEILPLISNQIRHDGARSQDLCKLDRDIELLQRAWKENPNDSRTTYFLAETYFCKRDFSEAALFYEKRIQMGGSKEEMHRSLYCLGKCYCLLGKHDEMAKNYCKAYEFDPTRIEPLYDLAWTYLQKPGKKLLSYLLSRFAVGQLHCPPSSLRLQKWIYDWGIRDLFALAKRTFEST